MQSDPNPVVDNSPEDTATGHTNLRPDRLESNNTPEKPNSQGQPMPYTLAFDVYGTLINTAGVVDALRPHLGERAAAFSSRWREKQLEYSFRRGLMGAYRDFSICTRDALSYTCREFDLGLTGAQSQALLDAYRVLPAFDDARQALEMLSQTQHRLYAFSNGLPGDVENLLQHACIRDYLLDVISVDEIKSFKPDPAVYRLFNQRTQSEAQETWLISSNPFDILGAHHCGFHTAWVQRQASALFDPWGIEPSATITGLTELVGVLGESTA